MKIPILLIAFLLLCSCKKTTTEHNFFALKLDVPNEFSLCGELHESEFSPPIDAFKRNAKAFRHNKYEKVYFTLQERINIIPSNDSIDLYITELKKTYWNKDKYQVGKLSNSIYSYYILTNNIEEQTTIIQGFYFDNNSFWSFTFDNYDSINEDLNKTVILMLKSARFDKNRCNNIEIKNTLNECPKFIKLGLEANFNLK